MVSKNNKHSKPKKKYKKRRTSFRNNKKNINLRSKSLKNNKGGAVGDNASDFGLPPSTPASEVKRYKGICDDWRDIDDPNFHPSRMRINYLMPPTDKVFPDMVKPFATDDNKELLLNKKEFEKARKTRLACYTYYKKAVRFSLSERAKVLFKGQEAKLANKMYATYDRLFLEDSAMVGDVKHAKNVFLLFYNQANRLKSQLEIAIIDYWKNKNINKSKIQVINNKYKKYLRELDVRLQKKMNDKVNPLTSQAKKAYKNRRKDIKRILKLTDPLADKFATPTKKKYIKSLKKLNDSQKKEQLQHNTSLLASDFNHYMDMMTSQLVLLNSKLAVAGLEPTIIEPVQWLTRDIGRTIKLTDDDKAMLMPDDQDNFKEWLFGENAPTDAPSLIRSLSDSRSIRSSSRESISSTTGEIDIADIPDPDDVSVTAFLRSESNDSNDNSEEMSTIMNRALTNASESSEFEGFSDDDTDSDNQESAIISNSNVIAPRVEGRQIRELDDAVIAALENSTPFTRPTRPPSTEQSTEQSTPSDNEDEDEDEDEDEGDGLTAEQRSRLPSPGEEMELPSSPRKQEGEVRPAEIPIPAPPPYSDDRKDEGEIRPAEVPESPPEELTVKFGVRDYPTTKLIETLFKQAVRDKDDNVVIDKEMKSWFKKNKRYKSCNEKDAQKLLENMRKNHNKGITIPSLRQLFATDLQKINDKEEPIYSPKPGKVFVVDERLQECGGILNVLEDNVDSRQKGLIMSVPQLSWVWKNIAKKDKKMQDEAVCFYKTFIGYCKKNDIKLSVKDQCNIPPDWDPDTNNLCKDTVDANKAVEEKMVAAKKQEEDINKYQTELATYNDRKAKHDDARNKPPTSDDVYAYINEASTGKDPGPVPGTPVPGNEPVKPESVVAHNYAGEAEVVDSNTDTSQHTEAVVVEHSKGGNNPIMEATITAMSQFGGADGDSSEIDLDVFSKCTAKKCKKFFGRLKDGEEFKKYTDLLTFLTEEEKNRLGGIQESGQDGLVVCLPQFDKVYNNKAITSTDKDKACLRCLYMGFVNLCKARGVTLDPELQQGITKDYKPGDIEYSIASNTQDDDSNASEIPDSAPPPPLPPNAGEDDTEEETKRNDDDEDDSGEGKESDDSNLRIDSSDSSGTSRRRPRGTGLPEVPDRDDSVNPPIQIITDNRKKDKYIWIKIKADPNCLTGVIDNTYDTSEDTLKKLINLDDDSVNIATPPPSAPPASSDRGDSDAAGTGTTPSAPPLDETEAEMRRKLGPPPPAPISSNTTSQVSKPSSGSTSNEPAPNLVNPEETKPEPKIGGCDNVPEETELRSAPPPGKAKKDDLFCPSQAPYLCGKKTITYQERLKNGLGAACRVKEHDCNYRKMPVGSSDNAKRVYQAADPETGLTARFYVDPQKDPGNITSCSKKTKGGTKKGGKKIKSLKNKRKKRKSLKN